MAQQQRIMLISGVISVALGFLAGFLGGRLAVPPGPEQAAVVRAEGLVLVDRTGRERARLGLDAQGMAHLKFYGDDDAALVSLAADAQGGVALALGDDKRQHAVVLSVAPQGSQDMAFYRNGQLRLGLEVPKNGEPAVNLYDTGNRVITLGLTNPGDPHLIFYGDKQKAALDLSSTKNGDRSLELRGKDGIPRVVLGLKQDRKAALGLFDQKGKTRVALMDEPSLILLRNGRLIRTLP
jgi:hypothetical protein